MGKTIVTFDEILKGVKTLEEDIPEISQDELNCWHSHNFYSQMMDVCGEIENTKRIKANYDASQSSDDYERLIESLNKVHRYCTIVRLDDKITPAKAYDLLIAEWFLRDCMIGDNAFNISPKYYTEWFDQWLYDINFDLLD